MGYTTRLLKRRRKQLVSEVAEPTSSAIKVAEEKGVDINLITGTGKGGRVIQSDVYDYVKANAVDPVDPEKETEGEGEQAPHEEE